MLEVMMSLVILAVGVCSVFALLLLSIQTDSESLHYTEAHAAAQEQLEWARQSVYTSLSSTATIPSTGTGSSLPPGAVVTAPTITANYNGNTGLTFVSVTITWPEPGRGTDSVTMDTYIASGGINQH